MQAGRLNEIIVIQRQNYSRGEYGETKIEEWYDLKKTRACVKYISGVRTDDNSELFFGHNVVFEIRIYHDIRNLDRIKFEDRLYRIMNIEKDKTVQRYIITTELINE